MIAVGAVLKFAVTKQLHRVYIGVLGVVIM